MGRQYLEDNLQEAVATYLDLAGVLWCHVGNERKTTLRAGGRLKRKGIKSGVPDCLIFHPSGKFNGLAIELKIKPNKPSYNQKEWLKRLVVIGWMCEVCYSLDEVVQVFEEYNGNR